MENKQKPNYVSFNKVLMIGDEGTGKSTLVKRFERGKFSNKIIHTDERKKNDIIINIIIIFLL